MDYNKEKMKIFQKKIINKEQKIGIQDLSSKKNNFLISQPKHMLWVLMFLILHAFLSSADFLRNELFQKICQEYHQTVKQL